MIRPLNFPKAKLNLTKKGDRIFVWCIIRKKTLVLTPEEWVRQHLIHYLINEKKIPHGLIAAEMSLVVNELQRRCDLVIFSKDGMPQMIIECKAPEVNLDQKVFDQIAQYNFKLGVDLLMVTNGLDHIICSLDRQQSAIHFLEEFPELF